jgi:hypothetical protein
VRAKRRNRCGKLHGIVSTLEPRVSGARVKGSFMNDRTSAREEYASDLARYLRDEIKRLRSDFSRIYQATIDNPEKLTIGDIAMIAKENAQ